MACDPSVRKQLISGGVSSVVAEGRPCENDAQKLLWGPTVAQTSLVYLKVTERSGFKPCLCHFDRWPHTSES